MQPSQKSNQNSDQNLEHFEMICVEKSSGPQRLPPRPGTVPAARSWTRSAEKPQPRDRTAERRGAPSARPGRAPVWTRAERSRLFQRIRQWGPLQRLSMRSWQTPMAALLSSMACTGVLLLTDSLDGSKLLPADRASAEEVSARQGGMYTSAQAEAFLPTELTPVHAADAGHLSGQAVGVHLQERALIPSPLQPVLQVQTQDDASSVDGSTQSPPGQEFPQESGGSPLQLGKRSVEVPLKAEVGGLWVDVRFNDQVTHTMLIDTGASVVILPGKIATLLGIHESGVERELRTIQGTLKGRLVTLNSVKLGGAQASGVAAVVVPGDDPKVIGLLGRSFLNQFSFGVDLDRNTLILRPRQTMARRGASSPIVLPALLKGPSDVRTSHQFALQALPAGALPTQLD